MNDVKNVIYLSVVLNRSVHRLRVLRFEFLCNFKLLRFILYYWYKKRYRPCVSSSFKMLLQKKGSPQRLVYLTPMFWLVKPFTKLTLEDVKSHLQEKLRYIKHISFRIGDIQRLSGFLSLAIEPGFKRPDHQLWLSSAYAVNILELIISTDSNTKLFSKIFFQCMFKNFSNFVTNAF